MVTQFLMVQVVQIQRGISSKSQKPYCRLVVKSKRDGGGSSLKEFWVSEDVSAQLLEVQEDEKVRIYAGLDDQLRFNISKVEKVDDEDDLSIFGKEGD